MKSKRIIISFILFFAIGIIGMINSNTFATEIQRIDVTIDLTNAMPKIGVRKAASVPVTIGNNLVKSYTAGYYWEKKTNDKWGYFSGTTFDQSEYRYHVRFEVKQTDATVSNPVAVYVTTRYLDKTNNNSIKSATEKIDASSSLVSGSYYISAYSKSFLAYKDENTNIYSAEAYATPDYMGEVYIASSQTDAGSYRKYTYAESTNNLGVFNQRPKPGYVFKEWRIGSATGTPVIANNVSDEESEEYIYSIRNRSSQYYNAPVYVDSKNGLHYKMTTNYKFYAIFERNTTPERVIRGDLNKDGYVNSIDSAIALDIFKNNSANEVYIKIGDLSNDGYINATDAAMILDCFKNGTITYVTI